MAHTKPIPLAIVGIGCRLPGGATSPEKLWDLLANGKSAWSRVPADRWNEDAFLHPDPDNSHGTHNHVGGHFLQQDMGAFDAAFFNVPPQEAAAMDPQQRLLLETTFEALESAGIPAECIRKSDTAVYMAMFTRDHDRNMHKDMLSIPKYHATGAGDAILANRISHLFDLHGPSMTMDTGCSGGMVAISQACQALRVGKCSVALAGGANLILSPDHMVSMSNLHMLNKDGRSYTFDSRGAGYGRGEGIASLVIKRLDDAIRDNDPIRSIILDASSNQDGNTMGITLPSGEAQQKLGSSVLESVGLAPPDIGYVEAHGTGTAAGDSAELDGISRVYCQHENAQKQALMVGSVKSNIGHLESVSGLAAVIKSVLVLEHGEIPPVVNFEQPKQGLDLTGKKLKVPLKLTPWDRSRAGPARVSVNSFGYGGTNAHAILEQAPKRPSLALENEHGGFADGNIPRLFVFSAANRSSLVDTLAATSKWLSEHDCDDSQLRDLAYTLSQRRSRMAWRFSCVASSQQDLIEALNTSQKKVDSFKKIVRKDDTRISFIFTGQGAQWAGMGQSLLSEPTFNASFQSSKQILLDLGSGWNLIEELTKGKDDSLLNSAEYAQPICTAVQIATVDMLRAWGVLPQSVVGHSSGEIAAAYCAGYMSHEDAIKASYYRGFSSGISKKKGFENGAMLAVGLGEDEVIPLLEDLTSGRAVVACQNSPQSTTVSGDESAIMELAGLLTDMGAFNRMLKVDTAYHSHHMEAAAPEYSASLGNMGSTSKKSNSGVALFSSVTGSHKETGFDSLYWTSNLVQKVRFCDALESLHMAEQHDLETISSGRQTHRIFIEVGPHCALEGPLRQCASAWTNGPMPYDYVSVLSRGKDAVETSLNMAGLLFARGHSSLDMKSISEGGDLNASKARVLYNLPSYPWDHSKRHWMESRLSRDYRLRKHAYHDLLGVRMTDASPLNPTWRHMVDTESLPWLEDHVVDGLMIFPGSGYLCMVIEGANQIARERNPDKKIQSIRLKNTSFLKALIIPGGRKRVEVQLSLSRIMEQGHRGPHKGSPHYSFSIAAFSQDEEWHEHCRGSVLVEFDDSSDESYQDSFTYEELTQQLDGPTVEHIKVGDLYRDLDTYGNTYGPTFSTLTELAIDGQGHLVAGMTIPDIASIMPANHLQPHIIHPSTLDILLHSTLPLVHQRLGGGSVMPIYIEDMFISTAIENEPNKTLRVASTLTSARFRATEVDLAVFSSGASESPVISMSCIDLRSLGPSHDTPSGDDQVIRRDICYEMTWGQDVKSLRPDCFTQESGDAWDEYVYAPLLQYLKHWAFKQSELSVLEVNDEIESTSSLAFIQALQHYGNHLGSYHIASVHEVPKQVQSRMREATESIQFITMDTASSQFGESLYDIVIYRQKSGSIPVDSLLASIRTAVKHSGILAVLHNVSDSSVRGAIEKSDFTDIQLFSPICKVPDMAGFIVARASTATSAHSIPPEARLVLDANTSTGLKDLATDISTQLAASLEVQSTVSTWSEAHTPLGDSWTIVIDDGSAPILSGVGVDQFRSVVDLVQKQGAKVIWITAQEREQDLFSPKKHLINGFARSAYAENENLTMVTIDAQHVLDNRTKVELSRFIVDTLVRSSVQDADQPIEREYIYRGEGAVLIPRLLPSQTLNRQVSGKTDDEPVVAIEPFAAPGQPLMQLDTTSGAISGHAIFEHREADDDLGDDEVDIQAKAFGIPRKGLYKDDSTLMEYAGIVTRVGSSVTSYREGDCVVALSSTPYASSVRVHHTSVAPMPDWLSFENAAAATLSFMAATHALSTIANLVAGQTVLVDDAAASNIGLACVTAAIRLGARVITTVTRSDEAAYIHEAFGLSTGCVLSRNSAKDRLRSVLGDGRIDAILSCGTSPIGGNIVKRLKPFGALVRVQEASSTGSFITQHSFTNAIISNFDIASLVQARPDLAAQLLQKACKIISQERNSFALKISTVPLSQMGASLKLVSQAQGSTKHVLSVSDDSMVRVARPGKVRPKLYGDVSYVIAGGMGDLGQRLLHLMVKAGAKYLVVLSRRGSQANGLARVQDSLRSISEDCQLLAIKCNVSSEFSVRLASSEIKASGFPAVKGVIQATAVLEDSTLDTMTADAFNSVLSAKEKGTMNLQKVFAKETLNLFVSFSSLANIIGTAGQANYNAGNSVQDALAQFGSIGYHDGCFYMSLNIGTIKDAAVNTSTIVKALQRQGLTPVTHEELMAFFEYALSEEARSADCHQPVIGFTPQTIVGASAAINGTAHSPMFTHVRHLGEEQSLRAVEGDGGSVEGIKSFKEALRTIVHQDEMVALVTRLLCNRFADMLFLDPTGVTSESSAADFGLDSLIAIEFRNWIMREFDAPIQSSEILESQTFRALAQKVTLRSRLWKQQSVEVDDGSRTASEEDISGATSVTSLDEDPSKDTVGSLRELPIPNLDASLQMFKESREAICSPEERELLDKLVEDFRETGLRLQESLKQDTEHGPADRLQFYEDNIHLDIRAPLQDHALFFIGHLTDGAPVHSQAQRAALVTGVTINFKNRHEAGILPQSSLGGSPLCMETLKWMFNSSQVPKAERSDEAVKHQSNSRVIVLRKGHLFEIDVSDQDDYQSLAVVFDNIITASESTEISPPVSVLTTMGRNEWARARARLIGLGSTNNAAIEAIESAAFVLSLDDSFPETSSERCTSQLLNDCHLTNRWLDKLTQFTVAANGVSAILCENSKIDGMSTCQLHELINDEITRSGRNTSFWSSAKPTAALTTMREISFDLDAQLLSDINAQAAFNKRHYEPITSIREFRRSLSRKFLASKGLRSKGVVLISILMALRLFFGHYEPAWETVTLAKFNKGRIDWLQSLTPQVVHWIESAMSFMKSPGESKSTTKLVDTLRAACADHVKSLRQVADGLGYVEPLYSLMGRSLAMDKAAALPPLFESSAWRHTDRNLSAKKAKTDCLGSGGYLRSQEGGFHMASAGSLFIHYEVHHEDPLINVQGREEDVKRFGDCLEESLVTMRMIIENSNSAGNEH